MSQKDTVLNHLKQHGHIDTKTAIKEYFITRLSAHILTLKNEGMPIVPAWLNNGKRSWVEYRLVTR